MATDYNIPEYQGSRTGPAHIVQDRISGSGLQRELGRAGNGNVLTEGNGNE